MIPAQPDWSRITHVLLDMDGTVLDLAFDAFFWGELVPREYALANALSLEAARTVLEPKFTAVLHTLPWYCVDYWTEVTGLDLPALKRQHRSRIGILPGSVDFLEAVRASGRALWLVTNAHRHSWELKLEHTGLAPLFDRIVSSHDHGAPKEDAAFWASLQRHAPFDPSRAFFADDSLPVLAAAVDHGIAEVVAIRRPDSTRPARAVSEFASTDSLLALLPLPRLTDAA